MKTRCALLLLCLTCFACVKDKPRVDKLPPATADSSFIFIANEGSLGNGNASLSMYDPETGHVFNHIFSEANGQPLGDVFQSMLGIGDRLYLAINNSDKVAVIDKTSFKLSGTIHVNKPRYMLSLTTEKMYVSSLFYPEINIVDPLTFQNLGKITVDYPNTEGMTLLDGKVYACNWDTGCNYIYAINPATNQITERIPIAGYAPQSIVSDRNNKLWVLAGNVAKNTAASLTQIDPASQAILKSFVFPPGAEMIKPVFNPGKDTLYFLGVNYDGGTGYNGLYRMAITANALPATPFIAAQPLQYFWGLGIDPVKNQIYLGDPKGFIQQGTVSVYNAAGTLLKRFETGLGPGFFYFGNR
jgi:DNA-binding beta-propeller fold protein YncE